jgi:hypothetical protein
MHTSGREAINSSMFTSHPATGMLTLFRCVSNLEMSGRSFTCVVTAHSLLSAPTTRATCTMGVCTTAARWMFSGVGIVTRFPTMSRMGRVEGAGAETCRAQPVQPRARAVAANTDRRPRIRVPIVTTALLATPADTLLLRLLHDGLHVHVVLDAALEGLRAVFLPEDGAEERRFLLQALEIRSRRARRDPGSRTAARDMPTISAGLSCRQAIYEPEHRLCYLKPK